MPTTPIKARTWLICYVDGKTILCDPTWKIFNLSAEDFTSYNLIAYSLNEISIVPDEFDPCFYEDLIYFDQNGELYNLQNGYLSSLDGWSYSFSDLSISFNFRSPSDGFNYGFSIVDCKSAYSNVFVQTIDCSYSYYYFFDSTYSRRSYREVIQFVAFEKLYYNNDIEIDFLESMQE